MAVGEFESIEKFEDWYGDYRVNPDGTLWVNGPSACASRKFTQYDYFKREMDARLKDHEKYEKVAAASVVEQRPDLPNVSSGESAGFLRRIARNVVQHTPNITVTSMFDDDSVNGILATYIAKAKIIGDDEYSNNMQQQLYATMIRASALGFDCVVPALLRDALGGWSVQYDTIHYRDVFPEPGVKDVRRAPTVFVRRYLSKGEVHNLIQTEAPGWDIAALKSLMQTAPHQREYVDHQSKKHSVNSEAYEIITWYTNSGDAFLTYAAQLRILLRIEKNKHPLKEHPVFFFVPEFDGNQPFGQSLLATIYGRQSFQDWFLNGAMKLWRLNIEPPIIGYGVVNTIPNIGPGKYTSISNPNARVEAFSIESQSLMMFNQITANNAANMSQGIGAADQQMAAQQTGGLMNGTPQGIEAQQTMVDTTTNNFQKALEAFFSRYCSYALTVYFQELKAVTMLEPSADARKQLIGAGMPPEAFRHEAYEDEKSETDPETNEVVVTKVRVPEDGTGLKDGQLEAKFEELAVMYWVKVVPGSLTELEDEKQLKILQGILIPITQALPAIAQSGNQRMMQQSMEAVHFLMKKQIEMSGSAYAFELAQIFGGDTEGAKAFEDRAVALEESIAGSHTDMGKVFAGIVQGLAQMQEQVALLRENQEALAAQAGVQTPSLTAGGGEPAPAPPAPTI